MIDSRQKNLEIRESISKGTHINRLSENEVSSYQEVERFLEQGDIARNVAETKLNSESSRSHTIFQVNIEIRQHLQPTKAA